MIKISSVTSCCLACLIATTTIGSTGFAVREPSAIGSFSIEDWNTNQIRNGFGFQIDVDESQLDDKELRDHLNSTSFETANGDRVKSLTFSREHDVIIGTSIDESEIAINLVQASDGEKRFVVQTRNKATGEFQIARPEDLSVMTLDGKPLSFVVQPVIEVPSIRISLALLIDRSGSMSGSFEEAVSALQEFADLLPVNAECLLLSFNYSYVDHGNGFADCEEVARSLSGLKASGGTDIFTPLLYAFDLLGKLPDHLRMVAIVTDGADHGPLSERDVLPRKTAPVAVLWRGWWSDAELKGIADTYLHSSKDFKEVMAQFLGGLTASVEGQFVITVRDDKANQEKSQ